MMKKEKERGRIREEEEEKRKRSKRSVKEYVKIGKSILYEVIRKS